MAPSGLLSHGQSIIDEYNKQILVEDYISTSTNNSLPPLRFPSPMRSGHTREPLSFSTRAALRASIPSPANALRPVQSVKDYNLAGVAGRDLLPGSVARLIVHF